MWRPCARAHLWQQRCCPPRAKPASGFAGRHPRWRRQPVQDHQHDQQLHRPISSFHQLPRPLQARAPQHPQLPSPSSSRQGRRLQPQLREAARPAVGGPRHRRRGRIPVSAGATTTSTTPVHRRARPVSCRRPSSPRTTSRPCSTAGSCARSTPPTSAAPCTSSRSWSSPRAAFARCATPATSTTLFLASTPTTPST